MKKSFAPFFCLLAIVGATLAPSTHAEEAPAPPPAADEFVKQLEMLRNDPVARAAAKEAVSKRVEELRKSMSEAQPKFDQTRTQLQTATDQAAALRGKIDELTKQLTSAQAELEQIEKGFAETQQQLEAARQQQTETGTPLLVYEQTLALLNAIDAKPDAAKTEAPPAAPPTPAPAPEPPAAATPVPSADTSVAGKARAVLAANCVSCHGAEKQKAGLRLDSREALIKGGENGTSIIPGDAEQSKLIRAIRYDGELQMPPKGKLDQPSIDALIEWVKQGAPPWSTDAPAAAAEQTASAPATVTPAPVVLPAVDEKDRVSFNRDVRPIIQNNCFACHGPDPAARKAGLRLDVEAEAVEALSPGNRGKSEVYEHISASDPEKIMPPVSSGKKLTPEQIATLGKWIDQGAKYEQHWAFIPPVSPAVPEVQRKDWAKNDIDRFVLARLEKEGLTPSPEADKEKLIRRVSLDLTGLPPTPQDVDAFIADASPDAYEKLVDRLLASPEYGEHIARSWLDLARYADTNGYHIDNERYMWRWREWVIDAFNKNMPFDQFTVEQIAGDLLPNAT
ncbi:MAG: DUF1549 domain-containing protein, partial [FCB group bacterium]|nr:DUF1549 domain-containing protein [FCB group bacterium]